MFALPVNSSMWDQEGEGTGGSPTSGSGSRPWSSYLRSVSVTFTPMTHGAAASLRTVCYTHSNERDILPTFCQPACRWILMWHILILLTFRKFTGGNDCQALVACKLPCHVCSSWHQHNSWTEGGSAATMNRLTLSLFFLVLCILGWN